MADKGYNIVGEGKKAVDNFLNLIAAPIITEMDVVSEDGGQYKETLDEEELAEALMSKRSAFVEAKRIIKEICGKSYKHQEWARDRVEKLVEYSNDFVNDYINLTGEALNIESLGLGAIDESKDVKKSVINRGSAFAAALEMTENIAALNLILEKDEIVFDDSEVIGGFAETYADLYRKMPNKSGYRKDIDAVVIDPNGTIGEIIELCDGKRMALPIQPVKRPKKNGKFLTEKFMMNVERQKKHQVFRRQLAPRGLNKNTAKNYLDFIDDEYKRRREGFWFMNNGIAEYITGAHWFLLTHFKTGADKESKGYYPDGKMKTSTGFYDFEKAQQKYFFELENAWCDERCYGTILEKIRRFGATDCSMDFSLCKGSVERDKICGMTSKTDFDVKANFLRMTWAFSNLPFYFKPICMDEKSKSKLEFSEPSARFNAKEQKKIKIDKSLNTYLNHMPTKADSYDGVALRMYLADEFSKWKKQNGNTIEHWEMVRKALTKGKKITGKAIILSTVEDVKGIDPYDNPQDCGCGDRYKWLYYNSNPNKRDANDRTLTGLYKVFISCNDKYEGFTDIYGYPIKDDPEKPTMTMDGELVTTGIKTFIANESAPFMNNPTALYEYFRKTPRVEADGFNIADGSCLFNQANLSTQHAYNDAMEAKGEKLYHQGDFRWANGVRDSDKVEFVPREDGRFRVSAILKAEYANKVIYQGGIRTPGNLGYGAFGIDPYKVSKTAYGNGSKGAMNGYSKANTIGLPEETFFLEYLARPKDIQTFFDDMIMAMVYYGMPSLIESNVDNLINEMYRRGYTKYSMRRPDKPLSKLTPDERKLGGMPSNGEKGLQAHASALENFIEHKVGNRGIDIDEDWGNMPFNLTITDWMSFDIKKRTKSDGSISSGLALIGNNSIKKAEPQNNKSKMNILNAFLGGRR